MKVSLRISVAGLLLALLAASPINSQHWIQMCKTGEVSDSVGLSDLVSDLDVVGDTLFMVYDLENVGYFQSINVADSQDPDSLGLFTFESEGTPLSRFVIDDGDALIAWKGNGLQVLDVSDAGNISHRDSMEVRTAAWDVDVGGELGNYAFIAEQDGLTVVNVSSRDSLVLVDTLRLPYVDPVDSTEWPNEARGVHADGAYVHIVGGGGTGSSWASYHIIDVFVSDSPKVVGQWISNDWTRFPIDQQHGLDVEIKGNYAYVAVDDDGIFVFSTLAYEDTIADSSCYPCFLGGVSAGSAKGLDIVGDYLYVAAQSSGWAKVFDLSDPANPNEVGDIKLLTSPTERVAVSSNRIFLSTSQDGIQILCHSFTRGDVDDDQDIDDDDVDDLLDYVFTTTPGPEPAEWNGDVKDTTGTCNKSSPTVNLGDVIHLNNFVNNNGDPPDCFVDSCDCF